MVKVNYTGAGKGEITFFGDVVALHYGENTITEDQLAYLKSARADIKTITDKKKEDK